MDAGHVQHMFNTKLAKCFGLYHVINPNTSTLYGYNMMHLLWWSIAAFMLSVVVLETLELCKTIEKNMLNVMFPISVIQNLTFSCFKILVLTRSSDDIWNCLNTVREDFISSNGAVRIKPALFRRFRSRSAWCTYAIASTTIIIMGNAILPSLLQDLQMKWIRSDDTVDIYRLNVFNFVYPVSADTYNRWYYAFYACELFIGSMFLFISNSFDIFVVPLCMSLCFHLESLAQEYRSLGHDESTAHKREANHVNRTTAVTLDQIKCIISCHCKVILKMNNFFTIIRRTILIQIIISSSTIVFLVYILLMYMDSSEHRFQGWTLLVASFYFTFQLLIPCYIFGLLNDTKDAMNFAIYSSNWTEMDIECKKLILLAMNMNNGNNLQMRITPTKVVNMALFKNTMHVCYSILSVMSKADIRK